MTAAPATATQAGGPWRSYEFSEMAYRFLSLVAKSVLAWQSFAGSLAS